MPRIATILVRRDTAANWTAANSVLLSGEQGFETDTGKWKVGTGATWNSTSYDAGSLAGTTAASAVNSANNALAVANSAATTAGSASIQASSAVTAANDATTAVAAKATLQTGALAASSSVAPNAQAVIDHVATQIAGVTAGSSALVSTTYSSAISLDKTQGRDMGAFVQTAAIDFTVAGSPTPVNNASCNLVLSTDATHAVTASGFVLMNGLTFAANRMYDLSFLRNGAGQYRLYGADAGAVDVTPPTLVSATITNANPDQVVLVYSESLSGTLAAASAFTVSGSTVNSRAAGGTPNTVILTLAAAVASGATKTTAYTKPGTNNLHDASGNEVANYSGVAITNNVTAGSGALTEAHQTVTSVDVTALSASGGDWLLERSGTLAVVRKTSANLITESTVNAGFAGFEHVGATFNYNNGGGPDSASSARAYSPSAGGTGKRTWVFPAGSDSRDAYVYVQPDNGQALTLRATLSDGSATELLLTTPTGTSGGLVTYEYKFTYNAADNSSRTLTVACEFTSYAMVNAAAYAP